MKDKSTRAIKILLVMILVSLEGNILLTLRCSPAEQVTVALPCQAVPFSFVVEHPDCVDSLLKAMNVTNVHVQQFKGSLPPLANSSANASLAMP